VWLGAEKDVHLSALVCTHAVCVCVCARACVRVVTLPYVAFPALMSCVMIVRMAVAVGRVGRLMTPEAVASFSQACAVCETVKSFVNVHSFGGCNEQNILNLELALFFL
jgi:hypothetical protein